MAFCNNFILPFYILARLQVEAAAYVLKVLGKQDTMQPWVEPALLRTATYHKLLFYFLSVGEDSSWKRNFLLQARGLDWMTCLVPSISLIL